MPPRQAGVGARTTRGNMLAWPLRLVLLVCGNQSRLDDLGSAGPRHSHRLGRLARAPAGWRREGCMCRVMQYDALRARWTLISMVFYLN
ncbi:hypothetical protein C8F01DRAFT_1231066 [Mycena amicta]|nr:hypothetical protein C8F01DRAFT_1231066 [Mycena amicta]